jgi:transaldolase
MKFFVDTADVNEIRELNDLGLIDGVTTNPSLIMKSGRDIREVTKEICSIVDGPVSAEVAATEYDAMMKEAAVLAKIADNICIKLPLTLDGLKACRALTSDGHMTNVTLCFSANQALLAAKAGASFISPFIGRLDDMGIDGMDLIREIRQIYDNYGFDTEILAASIRTVNHVKEAALIGADVATIPAGDHQGAGQAPADRQGPRSLPRRLEEDRPDHRLIRLAGSRLMKSI